MSSFMIDSLLGNKESNQQKVNKKFSTNTSTGKDWPECSTNGREISKNEINHEHQGIHCHVETVLSYDNCVDNGIVESNLKNVAVTSKSAIKSWHCCYICSKCIYEKQQEFDITEHVKENHANHWEGSLLEFKLWHRELPREDSRTVIKKPIPLRQLPESMSKSAVEAESSKATESKQMKFEWMRNPRPFYKKEGKRQPQNGSDSKRDRTTFNKFQRSELECQFQLSRYPSRFHRAQLAQLLDLTEFQVKVWFQNRRMKYKRWKSTEKLTNFHLHECNCFHMWNQSTLTCATRVRLNKNPK